MSIVRGPVQSIVASPVVSALGAGGAAFSLADSAILWFNPYDSATVTGSSPITSVADQGSDGGAWTPWAGTDPQTGPNLIAVGNEHAAQFDGTSNHSVEHANPTTTVVDLFMIVRRNSGTIANILNDDSGLRYVRVYFNGSAGNSPFGSSGSPTLYVDDVEVTSQGGFSDALDDGNWHRCRMANMDFTTWSKLRINDDASTLNGDIATLIALSPSDAADNLSEINTELDAMITELEAV